MNQAYEDTEMYRFVSSLKAQAIKLYHKDDTVSPELFYSIKARKSLPVRGRPVYEKLTTGERLPHGYYPHGHTVALLLKTQDRFYVYTLSRSASGVKLVQCGMIGFEYIEEVCLLLPEQDSQALRQQAPSEDS